MSVPHSSSDLEKIYRNRFSENLEYRTSVWQVLTSNFFSQWTPPNSTVLDLGCGYCEFINNIQAVRKYGMDLNPDARRNAAKEVIMLEQDCSQPWPVPDDSLDVVFTSNFFEHLPTKTHLEDTLRQTWRCLKVGGCLIAMGPNIKYVPGEYWDFFDHYVPLTELSLSEVLKKCGFEMERVEPRFLPYTMSGGRAYPTWMLKVYLNLPAVWPFFGKQFLVVTRKKAAV